MEKQNKAILLAVVAVLIWSTVASVFKLTLGEMELGLMLLIASLVTVLVLFVIVVYKKKLKLLKEYTFKDYAQSAMMGAINPFLYYLVLFSAYDRLPAQEAQPLNYTWPIWLVLLSILVLKQKVKPLSIVAIIISFIGVIVIALRGDLTGFTFSDPIGIGLGLMSAFIWASFWILNMKDKRDESTKLLLNFGFGAIYVLIAWFVLFEQTMPSTNGLMGAVYVGLFEMGITFFIWSMALKLSDNTARVSNMIYLTPFLSLVFIKILVGEDILFSTIIGLGLIVAGIVMQSIAAMKDKKKKK